MSTWIPTSSLLKLKLREFKVKEQFGKVQESQTRTGPLVKVQNPEPFSGPVLAGKGTMDQTTENQTKSLV
jgi:LEA14-like dessication related protein